MDNAKIKELIRTALTMRERAYAPYSHFLVGAALLTKEGRIYTGCNIENAAYTPTNCGERTAFFKAVSEGEREFTAIAVAAGMEGEPITSAGMPCGVCRQVMMEFCDPKTFQIISAIDEDHYVVKTLEELLPEAFGPSDLNKG